MMSKELYTKSGTLVAKQYERVVWGGRGPYVEIDKRYIYKNNLYVPDNAKWRQTKDWINKAFYAELRTIDISNVKVYHQYKPVDYADYKVDMYYISLSDLYTVDKWPLCDIEKKDENQTTLL